MGVFTGHLSEPGTENIFASDSSSASARPPWGFFCSRQGTRLSSVQFVVFNLLLSFSQRTQCWCQLSLVFKSLSSKKEAKVEPTFCCNWAGSGCRPVRVHRSQIIYLAAVSGLLFCGQRQLFFHVFLRSFTNASKSLFASVKAGSETMENGLLCGGERRKRSVDFVDELL